MQYRLRTLLIVLAVARQHLVHWLFGRRWLTFSLRGMFAVVTLLGIWLGFQVNWQRQRQDARRWIEQHGEYWSTINERDVMVFNPDGTRHHGKAVDAPWSLRLMGEPSVAYIFLLNHPGFLWVEA